MLQDLFVVKIKKVNMAEKFKTHMMFKGSKAVKATTKKKHLELKRQGYKHTKKS